MKLTFQQIKDVTQGSVRICEESGYFRFYRFTKEQEEVYRGGELYNKTFSTAGVRMVFQTDSTSLYIETMVSESTTRKYFAHDIFCDGKLIGQISNITDDITESDILYPHREYPLGTFSGHFKLDRGLKTIRIDFPWSVISAIKEIRLDDGAVIIPVKPKRRIIMFGDSITHGYDAMHPSCTYTSQLTEALCAEGFNKAIGGEHFCPQLAKKKDDFSPDCITIAYGTNDWNCSERVVFENRCQEFLEAISSNYPNAKIFVITPIWRKDYEEARRFGKFEDVRKIITDIAKNFTNINSICGWDFVPKEERFFADLRLHPNDEGFEFYSKSIISAIKQYF